MNLYSFHSKQESLYGFEAAQKTIVDVFAPDFKYDSFPNNMSKKQIKAISKNAEAAIYYVLQELEERWPEAEPAIMTDPEFAYLYALEIFNGPWPEAESIIMKDPEYAYRYAQKVLKRRWPEAEKYIANTTVPYAFVKKRSQHDSEFVFPKSLSEKQILAISKVPELAVHYAIYVIGGRWPEAEPYIMKAPQYATWYAEDVIGARWPEAEPYIIKDPEWWWIYKAEFENSNYLYN